MVRMNANEGAQKFSGAECRPNLQTKNIRSTYRAVIIDSDFNFQVKLTEALENTNSLWQVNCFNRGNSAISFLKKFGSSLDLVLIDIRLPDADTIEIITMIKTLYSDVPVLVFSSSISKIKFFAAIRAGALGFIIKDDAAVNLSGSIEQVLEGNTPISPSLAKNLLPLLGNTKSNSIMPPAKLSPREFELLECIAKGHSYARAAHEMGLQLTTIHAYSRGLFKKLKVRSKSEALLAAQKQYDMK